MQAAATEAPYCKHADKPLFQRIVNEADAPHT